jgi:hypothetical protein
MKKILLGSMIFFAFNVFSVEVSKVVECDNLSDDYPEDSLTLNFATNEASYFDNDNDTIIPCSFLGDNIYVCADSRWTIKVSENGDTTVYEGDDETPNTINFSCLYK